MKKIKKVHMVGIGGSGMSGIAEVLLNLGYTVSGSDVADSEVIERLKKLGARVIIGHSAKNVENAEVVVFSSAISDDNPEIVEAKQRSIPVIPRAEMLAELMRLKTGIAVAGTHGKTTSTSLLGTVFMEAGLDPTVIIGGRLNAYGTNAVLGRGEYLIAEADESDGSFLCLFPIVSMVTNIDADHMDFYPNLDAIKETFLKFMNMVPFYGVNVVCGDDENIMELIPLVKRSIITYGFKEHNTIRGEIIETGAKSKFKVFMDGEFWGECIIGIPGIHNILNGMGVIGVANHFGISKEHIIRALEGFKGVGRRLEKVGEIGGVLVVDDYGHHPTEIKTTLKTIKDVYPDKRLVVAFQPHRYTRTKALFGDFCKSFGLADVLLVTEIYPASEDPIPGVDGESLAKGIKQLSNTNVIYCEDLTSCLLKVKEVLNPGDLLLTLGAGNIWKVGVSYVHEREEI
ncbi:UDP-N-acetylmuramate--L-alanine ligase [Desulfothermus okinawensis]